MCKYGKFRIFFPQKFSKFGAIFLRHISFVKDMWRSFQICPSFWKMHWLIQSIGKGINPHPPGASPNLWVIHTLEAVSQGHRPNILREAHNKREGLLPLCKLWKVSNGGRFACKMAKKAPFFNWQKHHLQVWEGEEKKRKASGTLWIFSLNVDQTIYPISSYYKCASANRSII